MSIAKVSEIISESSISFEDAVAQGINRSTSTLRNVSEAWIQSQKAVISNGKVTGYRVILKVTFVLDD